MSIQKRYIAIGSVLGAASLLTGCGTGTLPSIIDCTTVSYLGELVDGLCTDPYGGGFVVSESGTVTGFGGSESAGFSYMCSLGCLDWVGPLASKGPDDEQDTTAVNPDDPTQHPVSSLEIIPGQGIGSLKLRDSFSDMTAILGAPGRISPSETYWSMFFFYDNLGITGSIEDLDHDERADDGEPIDMLIFFDPFEGQYQGVGIGSSDRDVLQVLGPPEEVQADGDHWYWADGIVFTMEDGVVTSIGVFAPVDGDSAASKVILHTTLLDEHLNYLRVLSQGYTDNAVFLGIP